MKEEIRGQTFVADEVLPVNDGIGLTCTHKLFHSRVVPGTLFGAIFNLSAVTFSIPEVGSFCGNTQVAGYYGTLNAEDGEIILCWSNPPGRYHLVVSYEYFHEEAKESKICTCSINTLMVKGCCCGHIRRYQS